MSESRKVIGEQYYKEALEKRGIDILRKEARELARREAKKERIASGKQKLSEINYKKELAARKAVVKKYEEKLEKAKKAARDNLSGMIGIIMLSLFAVLMASAILIRLNGASRKTAIIIMMVAFFTLVISMAAQAISMENEKDVEKYAARLRAAKYELQNFQIRHRRD